MPAFIAPLIIKNMFRIMLEVKNYLGSNYKQYLNEKKEKGAGKNGKQI